MRRPGGAGSDQTQGERGGNGRSAWKQVAPQCINSRWRSFCARSIARPDWEPCSRARSKAVLPTSTPECACDTQAVRRRQR